MCFHFLRVGHQCGPSLIIGRTWGDVRAKVRKQRKVWSARRARWRTWRKFGVDWEFVEQQSRIVDIKRARRIPSEQKCKIIDADKRVMKKLRVKKLSINKHPGLCVKPSLDTSNVRGKMFNENAVASQVTRNASSKRNASGFPSDYFLTTSTDVVTLFFFHSIVLERWHLERSWVSRRKISWD